MNQKLEMLQKIINDLVSNINELSDIIDKCNIILDGIKDNNVKEFYNTQLQKDIKEFYASKDVLLTTIKTYKDICLELDYPMDVNLQRLYKSLNGNVNQIRKT